MESQADNHQLDRTLGAKGVNCTEIIIQQFRKEIIRLAPASLKVYGYKFIFSKLRSTYMQIHHGWNSADTIYTYTSARSHS